MPRRDEVLIVSRSAGAANAVSQMIGGTPDLASQMRVLDPAQTDPLLGIARAPDVLLLRVNGSAAPELVALARYGADRPPLIVIGDAADAHCMRAAMQAGARDFLIEPVSRDDLLAAIRRVTSVQRGPKRTQECRVTAFVNAKGGCGATFLACNVAHMATCVSGQKTALMDLDLQFATLPKYLDLEPARGLLDALDVADDLDPVAMEGFLARHGSGLAVLCGTPDSVLGQHELLADRFDTVLSLLIGGFERLVVDLPRHIDAFSARVLERADDIVLVLQQSVPSVQDAARMYDILTRSLAVPSDHIRVAVNRYRKNASVELSDIRQTLHGKEPSVIPNDFKAVTESIDMGIPLYDHARRSPVAKALLQLEQALGGRAPAGSKGFFGSVLRVG